MADIATANGGNINVCKSTGSAFTCSPWTTTAPGGNGWGAGSYTWAADFNGDGKADIATANFGNINVCISTGSTFTCSPWTTTAPGGNGWGADVYTKIGDFNGDGKADIATINGGNINVCISTGSSFTCTPWTTTAPGGNGWGAGSYTWAADFNGDGKTDIATANGGNINVCFSTGSSFTCATSTVSAGNWGTDVFTGPGDFNGDGKIDIASANGGTIWVKQSNAFKVDLLSSISNGIGGTTTIGYTPSTQYSNSCLPFPIQTVSSIATSTPTIDGSTQTSTTTYSYDGGCFYIPERDFRGFNHVTATGPVGPNLEQAITQTWFHQGNDVAVDANVPKVANGYMKGKPYRVLVTDGQGREFSKNEIIYTASNTPPYFNPPYQVDNWTCDGSPCSSGKQTETIYVSYDAYGNPTQEYQKGDVLDQNDDRTILRTFTNNQTPWIVGLPLSETIYKGNGTTNWVAQTNFYYDSAPDCNTASANQTPTVGNLTRVVRWLSQGGGNIETRTAYDSYGNPTCMRDANGNITNISYDSSSTFPKVLTQPPVNQFQLQTTTQYYGIDGVAVDTGLYGQVKSVTDPNGAVTTMTYDVFGRKLQITSPNTLSQTFTYPCVASTGCTPDPTNVFGSVGSQYIKESAVGLFTSTYFDGLNRTIKVKKSGPGGKTIANNQEYNVTGTIKRASLPYFDGIDTPKWQTFIYDAIGRATQTTNPDGSTTSASYTPFVVTGINASGHQKRETSDAYGHLTKIEEFTGVAPAVTLYATTNYGYDILGNLISVDNNGIKTTMRYDSLKRKIAMSDPDMGSCGDLTTLTPNATFPWYSPPCWNYLYDANGNLIKQIDAQGTQLVFVYDALNRVLRKSFTDLSPPSAPSSPAANAASASQINLSWGAASDNIGIKEYRIERCNYRPGTTACSNFAQITSAPTTSYSNTGLTDGMVYIYRIRAMDTSGNLGGYSSTVSATTPDVTPPNVPNLVVTVFSSNRIDLSWSSIDNVGVTAYELGRCQGAGCTPGVIATNSNTNYFDTQLTPNTSYTYRVRARDAAGNWSSYATVTKSTPVAPADTTTTSVPGSFSATTANPTQVNLTWASSTDNLLLAYYEVERSANNGPYVLVGAPAATNFTDSSATSGVIYFYRVRAVDGAGNKSGYSARDLATTFPFTDDPLISGTTPIKSVHITELRQAVNSLRTFAGLSAATWTDANLTGVPMKPVHIQELRTNLNQALTTLGLLLPNYTDPTITSLVTVRKSVHIQELRQGLK